MVLVEDPGPGGVCTPTCTCVTAHLNGFRQGLSFVYVQLSLANVHLLCICNMQQH